MAMDKEKSGFAALEKSLKHTFEDSNLLETALTHRSYAHEHRNQGVEDNERLEFLGDAVLDLVVAELLMNRFPAAKEGALSRARAALVSEKSLALLARGIELGGWLILGRGEKISGGRKKNSLLADSFEAVIAALYLEGGLSAVFDTMESLMAEPMERVMQGELNRDAKSRLQEFLQANYATLPSYKTVDTIGPEHKKTFVVEISLWGSCVGRGEGRSKKEAEKEAAKKLLKTIEAGDLDLDTLRKKVGESCL